MLTLSEKVMYGTTGVCSVERIEEKRIGRTVGKYYVLKPVSQSTSTVYVPYDNEKLLSKVRKVITPDEIKELFRSLSEEPDIWFENDAERRMKYNDIISSGGCKQYLLLIRTLYNRQVMLSNCGKRLHISDERALKEARRLISDEFSYALGTTREQAEKLVEQEFKK